MAAARKWAGDKPHAQTWPFIDYPAYSPEHGPTLQTDEPMLYAEFADREPIAIDPAFMGLGYYSWRYRLIERLVAKPIETSTDPGHARLVEQHRAEAYARICQQIAEQVGQDVTQLTLERTHYTIRSGDLQRRSAKQPVVINPPLIQQANSRSEEG